MSIFLIAVGAILAFAVEAEAEGINVEAVGVILLILGFVGLLLSLVFWSTWGGFGRRTTYVDRPVERDVVVERRRPRRTTVIEDDDLY